jgi:hypothetical protein
VSADRSLAAIEAALDAGLPASEVKTREGGGGKALSFVDQFYIRSRLLDIFGPFGFDTETTELTHLCTEKDDSGRFIVSYRATVQLNVRATCPSADGTRMLTMSSFRVGSGFGTSKDKSEGAAHEKALKEAETALYDKEQTGVVDDAAEATSTPKKKRASKKADEAQAEYDGLKSDIRADADDSAKTAWKQRYAIAKGKKQLTDEQALELRTMAAAAWAPKVEGGQQ